MTDRIVLKNSGFPISPMRKVTHLNRENQDPEKRRFQRHLEEEEDEKNKDDVISLESKGRNSAQGKKRKDKDFPRGGGEKHRPDREKNHDNDLPGSLVDIHV